MWEPVSNETMGAIKPRYTGITNECIGLNHKELWRRNCIPYFGLLSSRYSRGMADAYELITDRYVRMKGIVWPDEYLNHRNLFLIKHPEFRGKTSIDRNFNYYAGAYWNEKRQMICQMFGGYEPICAGDPISPKPEKRNKEFIRLSTIQMQRIAKGYK